MKKSRSLFALILVIGMLGTIRADEMKVSKTGEYSLADFGKVTKVEDAQKTMDKACKWIIENGGGILIAPPGVSDKLEIKNLYQQDRKSGPTVTIIDRRKGYDVYYVPQVGKRTPSGWYGEYHYRCLNLKKSLPHCGVSNLAGYRNALIKGAVSYMQLISMPVKKGKDARIYVPTIRGLSPGSYLTLPSGVCSYKPPYDRLRVKTIGYDAKAKANYITADLKYDHPAGAILYNKHVTGAIKIETSSNCDNQTMEFQVIRNQYAHGDNFNISSMYSYQGDVFSGLGDERGVGLNSEVAQDVDPFHGVVEKVDWKDNAIVIKPGACNIHKLATSRPLINTNQKKWITAGKVRIVPPEDWGGEIIKSPAISAEEVFKNGIDVTKVAFTFKDKNGETQPSIVNYENLPLYKFKYVYKNRAYPSVIFPRWINNLGGYIEGSTDCGWTEAVVGRFFAVADKGEYLYPGDKSMGTTYGGGRLSRPAYRWYKIKQFKKNPDGTCSIKIERIRWAASDAGAPNLYNHDDYTWEGHDRPMDYIIAPGAYVYDIGDAWEDRQQQGGVTYKSDPRTIRVVPKGDRNTAFDFAPGDTVVQAIGPDPAIPVPIRIRMFNHTPDIMEGSAIYMVNSGTVAMANGISMTGRGIDRDVIAKRKDRKPFYNNGINIATVTGNGIRFHGDVTNAALMFDQPHDRTQPIKWRTASGEASLTVDPVSSDMRINGSALAVSEVKDLKGISGTGQTAKNLRGIDVPVSSGAKQMTVNFPKTEVDGKYSLSVLPSWFTQIRVKEKTARGFTVEFSAAAPADAKMDWQMIR